MSNNFLILNGIISGSNTFSGSVEVLGTFKLPDVANNIGTTETKILVTDDSGNIRQRSNLSLQGTSGTSGNSGTSGTSGNSGTSGTSGTNGTSGNSGTSGTSGNSGTSGSSGTSGNSGTSGSSGTSGNSGTSGTSGNSGTSGSSGTSGNSGTSGSSGTSGNSGTSGSSGTSGNSGTSGTSGNSGTSGTSGNSGTSGSSGTSGNSGTSGTSGNSGTSGTSGNSGTSGTSGNSGTSGTSGGFTTNSNAQVNSLGVGTGASNTAGEIRATDNITAYYSDKRLKKDIEKISDALSKLERINGVFYTQNELAEKFGYNNYSKQVGVIAQEIQEVLPEAVAFAPFDRDENDNSKSGQNYLTVRYEKIVPLLIEAIKELLNRVENLEK
jgi:hypothetical protein